MATARARVIVSGVVQGVFFRETTRREALGRDLSGWVRNLSDGRVEAVFEGEPESVDDMVAWARTGPPRAIVVSLERFAEQPEELYGFDIRS
jgi:acylphosphatase